MELERYTGWSDPGPESQCVLSYVDDGFEVLVV